MNDDDLALLPWPDLLERLHDWLPGESASGAAGTRHARAWIELDRRLKAFVSTSLAPHLGLSVQDSEDVAQASMLKLQSGTVWQRLRSADSIVGYLLVVVRNQAVDLCRRRSIERGATHQLDDTDQIDAERQARDETQALERLRSVVAALTGQDLELLALRYWQNQTLVEIAHKFHLPYSTVAGRMYRIIQRLRHGMRRGD